MSGKPSHPLISCGTPNLNKEMSDYVSRITMPIFEEALQETSKKRMSVGRGLVERQDVSLYQPHNYRLYFDFQKAYFSPPKPVATDALRSVVTTSYEYKLKNSTEHFFKDFEGCNITVKKSQVEVINKLEHKRWFVIKHGEVSEYESQIRSILKDKDAECVRALKKFIALFGGVSHFKVLNRRSEDKVKFEDSIDVLKLKSAFHFPTGKKVYDEPSLEFKDPVFAVTYFENRAIEKIAPDIAMGLQAVLIGQDPLKYLKSRVSGVDDIKNYAEIISPLSDFDKNVFWDWVFDRFGGMPHV